MACFAYEIFILTGAVSHIPFSQQVLLFLCVSKRSFESSFVYELLLFSVIHLLSGVPSTWLCSRNYNPKDGPRGKPISKDEAMKELIEVVSTKTEISSCMQWEGKL